jgi:NADP-dependent 3-hydroxy acid dehydrogenase YdfG
VITGASRGIGAAIAHSLASAGARVILVARNTADLARVVAEIGSAGNASAISCDLSGRGAAERAAVQIMETLGTAPDMLVNCAGSFDLAPAHEMTAERFAHTLDVNLIAPFVLARAFLPAMRARGTGHLVTIGSIADRVVFPENISYAASKFGVRAMHEVLREELRGTGVRATLVSPAAVDTPLWDAIAPDGRAGFTPRARMLRAESVADAVLYAVSAPPDVNVDELRLSRA